MDYCNEPKCCANECVTKQKEMTVEDLKAKIKSNNLLVKNLQEQINNTYKEINRLENELAKRYRNELLNSEFKLEGACIKKDDRFTIIEEVTSIMDDAIQCKTFNVDIDRTIITSLNSYIFFQEIVENRCSDEAFNEAVNTVLTKLSEKYSGKGIFRKNNISEAENLIDRMDSLK